MKRGTIRLPPFECNRRLYLEAHSQTKLQRPALSAIRSRELVVHDAKSARAVDTISRAAIGRIERHKVVQKIHELERQRSGEPLRRSDVLGDGSIEVPEPEATNYARTSRIRVLPENRPAEFVEDRARIRKHIEAGVPDVPAQSPAVWTLYWGLFPPVNGPFPAASW